MKKRKKFLTVLLVCAMFLTLCACGGSYSEFEWPDSELGKILPQPDMKLKGEITSNDEDNLTITIAKASTDGFNSYVEICADDGFDLEVYSSDEYYTAKNELGYELSVDYDKKDKTMTLHLRAYDVYGEFRWPDSEIGQLLPVPKSNYGSISWEASYGFVVYVAQTSLADFNEYVDSCKDNGFTVDYRAGDDYYYADNEKGYSLTLNYNEGDVMFVRIDEPDESENTTITNETSDETLQEEITQQDSKSGIRQEFKDMMDSYEAFFDEYCEFMKKYNDSDDVTAMLADYTDYMTKYVEFMGKLEEVDEDELSTEEALYYAEVSARISKKVLEVAQ